MLPSRCRRADIVQLMPSNSTKMNRYRPTDAVDGFFVALANPRIYASLEKLSEYKLILTLRPVKCRINFYFAQDLCFSVS